MPIVGAEQHEFARDRRREAHRPLGRERPDLFAAVGLEAIDRVVRGGAEVNAIADADDVEGVIERDALGQIVLLVVIIVLRLRRPSRLRRVPGVMDPRELERKCQRIFRRAAAAIVVQIGGPIVGERRKEREQQREKR